MPLNQLQFKSTSVLYMYIPLKVLFLFPQHFTLNPLDPKTGKLRRLNDIKLDLSSWGRSLLEAIDLAKFDYFCAFEDASSLKA